jgi:ABC-type phosphate/phosphonate transport system permease subunit
MKMKELITGTDGKLSHTKIWSNIANATSTWIVIKMAFLGTLTPDIFMIYLIFVGASRLGSEFIARKYGGALPTESTKEE